MDGAAVGEVNFTVTGVFLVAATVESMLANALEMFSISFGRSLIVFKTSFCVPEISTSFWFILTRNENGMLD